MLSDSLPIDLCQLQKYTSRNRDASWMGEAIVLEGSHRRGSLPISFLHLAVLKSNEKAIGLLIDHGLDCLQKNNHGKTPLEYALEMDNNKCVMVLNKLLCQQCRNCYCQGNYKKSKQLLAHIVDSNVFLEGGTLLLHEVALLPGDKTIKFIPLLLAKGADVNLRDKQGRTLLLKLMQDAEEKLSIIEMLLAAGANVNIYSDPNRSLLHCALFDFACEPLAKLLLEYGAQVDAYMLDKEYPQELKDLLQAKFNGQRCCCICFENLQDLSGIPCTGKHAEFLCQACYQKLAICPLCRAVLGKFDC
jgi:hypothetical protein